jgi:hypothetical protein
VLAEQGGELEDVGHSADGARNGGSHRGQQDVAVLDVREFVRQHTA